MVASKKEIEGADKPKRTFEERKAQLIQRILDGKSRLSHSAINAFRQSPRHFIEYKLNRKEPTAAMEMGTLVHCLLLEPEEFEDKYIIAPDIQPKSAQQKEYLDLLVDGWRAVEAINSVYKTPPKNWQLLHKTYADYYEYLGRKKEVDPKVKEISFDDYENAKGMANAVRFNDTAGWLYRGLTQTEKKVEWEAFGYNWIGYIDGEGDTYLVDLKKIANAAPKKIRYAIRDDGYGLQSAHYTFGPGIEKDYYLVAVDPQLNVSVTEIDSHARAKFWEDLEWIMSKFEDCLWRDLWHQSYEFWAGNYNGFYKY